MSNKDQPQKYTLEELELRKKEIMRQQELIRSRKDKIIKRGKELGYSDEKIQHLLEHGLSQKIKDEEKIRDYEKIMQGKIEARSDSIKDLIEEEAEDLEDLKKENEESAKLSKSLAKEIEETEEVKPAKKIIIKKNKIIKVDDSNEAQVVVNVEDKNKASLESMTLDQFGERVSSYYSLAVAKHLADDPAKTELFLKVLSSFINEAKKLYSTKDSKGLEETLNNFIVISNDKDLFIEEIEEYLKFYGEDKDEVSPTTMVTPDQGSPLNQPVTLDTEGNDKDAALVNKGTEPDQNTNLNQPTTPDIFEELNHNLEISQKKVELTRSKFFKEYKKCESEAKRQSLIDKTRNLVFNVLAGARNIFNKNKIETKKSIKVEEYFTKEAIDAKEEYYHARKEMGEALFEKKKAELEKTGLTGEDLKNALFQYKATEILKEIVIEEKLKLIDNREKPIKEALWKRLANGYLSIKPPWKKVAFSTLLFLPLSAAGAAGAALIGTYGTVGLVGLASVKFGASMLIGAGVGHAAKGLDLINKKADAEFLINQNLERSNIIQEFSEEKISIEDYEKKMTKLEDKEKARAQNRVLLKAVVGAALAIAAGFGAYTVLGNGVEHLTNVTGGADSLGVGRGTHNPIKLPTQPGTNNSPFDTNYPFKAPGAEADLPSGARGVLRIPQNGPEIQKHGAVFAEANNGQGAISTIHELKDKLVIEYKDDLINNPSNVPESVKHILNTDPHDLAREFGMYKPGQDAESVLIKSGEKFTVDQDGNVKFENTLLEKGTDLKGSNVYDGTMMDTDQSGLETKVPESIPQYDPTLPDSSGDLEMNELLSRQIDPAIEPTQTNPEFATDPNAEHPVAPEDAHKPAVEDSHQFTNKELREIKRLNNHNLNHIFPNYDDNTWDHIKGDSARSLYNLNNSQIKPEFQSLAKYEHQLHRVTGLEPRASGIFTSPETHQEYIERALKKAALLGKLKEIKL